MGGSLFIGSVRVIITFLYICPLYITNYEILEYKTNKADLAIIKFIQNTILILALISFWTATIKRPKAIPKVNFNLINEYF